MDTLWESGKTMIDTENVPDPRVRIMKSTMEISDQLERQVQRAEALEWQFTEYKKRLKREVRRSYENKVLFTVVSGLTAALRRLCPEFTG